MKEPMRLGNTFDLAKWDEALFARRRAFVRQAEDVALGILRR